MSEPFEPKTMLRHTTTIQGMHFDDHPIRQLPMTNMNPLQRSLVEEPYQNQSAVHLTVNDEDPGATNGVGIIQFRARSNTDQDRHTIEAKMSQNPIYATQSDSDSSFDEAERIRENADFHQKMSSHAIGPDVQKQMSKYTVPESKQESIYRRRGTMPANMNETDEFKQFQQSMNSGGILPPHPGLKTTQKSGIGGKILNFTSKIFSTDSNRKSNPDLAAQHRDSTNRSTNLSTDPVSSRTFEKTISQATDSTLLSTGRSGSSQQRRQSAYPNVYSPSDYYQKQNQFSSPNNQQGQGYQFGKRNSENPLTIDPSLLLGAGIDHSARMSLSVGNIGTDTGSNRSRSPSVTLHLAPSASNDNNKLYNSPLDGSIPQRSRRMNHKSFVERRQTDTFVKLSSIQVLHLRKSWKHLNNKGLLQVIMRIFHKLETRCPAARQAFNPSLAGDDDFTKRKNEIAQSNMQQIQSVLTEESMQQMNNMMQSMNVPKVTVSDATPRHEFATNTNTKEKVEGLVDHAKFFQQFLDDLIQSFDRSGRPDAAFGDRLIDIGRHHSLMRDRLNLKAQSWDEFADCAVETVTWLEGIRQNKECAKAWRLLIAAITEQLRTGYDMGCRRRASFHEEHMRKQNAHVVEEFRAAQRLQHRHEAKAPDPKQFL